MHFKQIVIFLALAECVKASQNDLEKRKQDAKLDLWSRGVYDTNHLMENTATSFHRMGPVRKVRQQYLDETECLEQDCPMDMNTVWKRFRGGAVKEDDLESKLISLGQKFGTDFTAAIQKNIEEHNKDCEISCESYYCADENDTNEIKWDANGTSFDSFHFGAVPPEDFSNDFGFPLDLIKVTKGEPLFSAEEAANVIQMAQEEGVDNNEYKSGKYKLGGDWLTNLPNTRQWFNEKLKTKLFPLLHHLFPEIVSSPSVLRAHSVSLLKYNITHPRTDVHIDNGILAMTLAMTPKNEYKGGGTFYEHFDHVLPMDVGHGQFRPGSVRHGGHKVHSGTRYILGAFLLIQDRVEHVRRLKNRGSELRRIPDLENAAKHFEWALALNPKCTTCLKDWAEILLTQKRYDEAEQKLRKVLELLEEKDSDALFSLGVILSEAGKDDESIEAYTKSVKLNAEDAELCYNLGIKLGAKGDVKAEMAMYARATTADPTFGGAWLNWGTVLAEQGNIEDAEVMFLKGLGCPEVKGKSMMNLGLVYQKQAELAAASGNLENAKKLALDASSMLDSAKPLLDSMTDDDDGRYKAQFTPLRLQAHRILGSVYAGLKDFSSCEQEFRKACDSFPQIPGSYEMLARVLDIQGKNTEAQEVRQKLAGLVK
ncbi:tetratricopeptide repeat family protein [Chaetoceros tenuissimus]|uniref:Tetratricopeptide repeat family protein n=1 Tax=Chaetoceros tenuissimus TaxID=426638 RepID=A0AAD3D584_9STRA|nr:tetratricopeptide repeat family protein [Chaetoceros tenuissimus]